MKRTLFNNRVAIAALVILAPAAAHAQNDFETPQPKSWNLFKANSRMDTSPITPVVHGSLATQESIPADSSLGGQGIQMIAPEVSPSGVPLPSTYTTPTPSKPYTNAAPGVTNSVLDPTPSVVGHDYFDNNVAPYHHGSAHNIGSDVNRIIGVNALIFNRDFDDETELSSNLNTADANQDDFGGFEFNWINRFANGRGWSTRYFGIFADDERVVQPTGTTSLNNLSNLNTSLGTADALFNTAGLSSVTRSSEYHNFELNRLRRLENCFFGRSVDLNESIVGIRYFGFDDSIFYTNAFGTPIAGAADVNLNINTDNDLYGIQVGRRIEKSLRGRLGWSFIGKFGIFNNHVDANQSLTATDGAGTVLESATIVNQGGANYDFTDDKNELAFLLEIDSGITYQIKNNVRARIGYRTIGLTGVALADDQISGDFNNVINAQEVNTEGDFTMNGAYFGIEWVR